jgi:hypothetical protein
MMVAELIRVYSQFQFLPAKVWSHAKTLGRACAHGCAHFFQRAFSLLTVRKPLVENLV